MKNANNTNNTLNATETTAKITTAEALDIIAENYEVLQQFEDDYNRFIEKARDTVGDNVMDYLLIDNHRELTGEIWENLSVDHFEASDGSITAYVGMAPYYISNYVYDQEEILEGEEDGELPVEIRNFVAKWENGVLEKVLDNTMYDLNEKLDKYIRVIDEYDETKRNLDRKLDEYLFAIQDLKEVDPDAAKDYKIDFDNDYFRVSIGYYGYEVISEVYEYMNDFYYWSDEGDDFDGWAIQNEFDDIIDELCNDIRARIASKTND